MGIVVVVCGKIWGNFFCDFFSKICGKMCGKMCGKIEKLSDWKKICVVLNIDHQL